MNSSHFTIISFLLALCIIIPLSITHFGTAHANSETVTAQNNLSASTLTAVETAYSYSDSDSLALFSSDSAREEAIKAFYENFTRCIGANMDTDLYYYARYLIPCIAMIDYDGYYLMYAKSVSGSDGEKYVDIITPINTWEEQVDDYIIRYYLSNELKVKVISTGDTYSGTSSEVYEKMVRDYGTTVIDRNLAFLNNVDEYTSRKNECIMNELQRDISYTINNHNSFKNQYDVKYNFSMPQLKGDFQDVLNGPAFIAFEQGQQIQDSSDTLINVYALTSADVVGMNYYYIVTEPSGDVTYHKADCPHLTDDMKENAKIGTAKYCALHKAHPCGDCIH